MSKTEPAQYATRADIQQMSKHIEQLALHIDTRANRIGSALQSIIGTRVDPRNVESLSDLLMTLGTGIGDLRSEMLTQMHNNIDSTRNDLLNGMVNIDDQIGGLVEQTAELTRTSARQFDILMGMLTDVDSALAERKTQEDASAGRSESQPPIQTADIQWKVLTELRDQIEKSKYQIALLRERIKALESDNVQENVLSERRGETETPETPISVPHGYRVERVAYNSGNIVEVVQRWLDSTPEFFQVSAGGAVPVPADIRRFTAWSRLEFVLLSAAERLRRVRSEALKSQLGAYGPESYDYPRLKTQGTNDRTAAYQGKS